jgi:hypothetical protein
MRAHNRPLLPIGTSAATAVAIVLAAPAHAQTVPPEQQPTTVQPQVQEPAPAEEDPYADEGGEIVVTGVRRGSVIGDIPPENVLGSRDVRATGATDITELLDALAPQIGSARGRGGERPVLLLNGQRISGFREIRDIPTEAISRVEILPEEVALKYGYSADQRVVNIVLRERFRSTTARLDGTTATEGGYLGGRAELTQLQLGRNGRTTVNFRAEGNSALTEDERDIELEPGGPDERAARTLIGSRKLLRAGTTINRTVLGDVSATANTEVEHSEGRSLFGLSDFAVEPLVRRTNSNSAHLGLSLNGNKGKWRWSLTGNADAAHSETRSDREDETGRDRVETLTRSGDIDVMGNGPLFALPAGDAGLTVRVGGSTLDLDNDRRTVDDPSLTRSRAGASASLDLPISRRNRDFSALGNLTLNANAKAERFSDFGTLTTVGAGLNWSPVDRLTFLASWTREEGAPTIQQLGDPLLITPETRVFDFRTGQTVLATVTTGGNPDLLADRRSVMKFGGNWKPFEETDLRFRAEYVHSRLDRPVSTFPGPSEALEAAFPERFGRAPPLPGETVGQLLSVDFRPVNFDEARRETIRWGFDFSRPLRSARPSQTTIDQFRRRRAQAAPPGGPPPEDATRRDGSEAGPPRGASDGPGGFRGFGGRFGGGRQRGRLQFSLTHTINLVDEVTIGSGLPELDFLHGDALGSTGGRPRHQFEAQGGYFNNGLGARLSANWRSGTHVDSSIPANDLRFSPLATFDLRLFANFGERFDLVAKHPWLRGASLRFEVKNLLDSKPRVRNALGAVPTNFQPDLLDPLGRTVSISIRKLFLPPRSFVRRQQPQPQPQPQPPRT